MGLLLGRVGLENGCSYSAADGLLDSAAGIGCAAEDVPDKTGNLENGVDSGEKDNQQDGNLGNRHDDLPGCIRERDVEGGQHDLANSQQDDVADHGIEAVLDERLEPTPEQEVELRHKNEGNQDRANDQYSPQREIAEPKDNEHGKLQK